jgi:hypothetical protein
MLSNMQSKDDVNEVSLGEAAFQVGVSIEFNELLYDGASRFACDVPVNGMN